MHVNEDALAAAGRVRDALREEWKRAPATRQSLLALDADSALREVERLASFQAATAREWAAVKGLLQGGARERGAAGDALARTVAEIRQLAHALHAAGAANRALAERALGLWQAQARALGGAEPATYNRRGLASAPWAASRHSTRV